MKIHEFELNNKLYLIEEDIDGDFAILGYEGIPCFSSLNGAENHIKLVESEKLLYQKCVDLGVRFFRSCWDKISTVNDFQEEGFFHFKFAYIPTLEAGEAFRTFLENEAELHSDSKVENILEIIPEIKYSWETNKFPYAVSDTDNNNKYHIVSSDDFCLIKTMLVEQIWSF